MPELALTIALDNYDRHLAFFMGTASMPPGVRLRALNVGMAPPARDGLNRHRRMLHDLEFDIAEVSLSSYILGKSQGRLAALTAIPVFPRRLFSQNQMFVRTDAGIETPADLLGKRTGIWSFQTTLSVLAKGDLKATYGVDWAGIHWITQFAEEIAFEHRGNVTIELAPRGRNVGDMLLAGELDAVFMPHPPPQILGRPDRVRRLFGDTRGECLRYWRSHGYYPIMHLLALKQTVADATPWLPAAIQRAWDSAKHRAEDALEDPAFSSAIFAHQGLEAQRRDFGVDLWPSGLAANRANLEMFIAYMHDQGLIPKPLVVDELFHSSPHKG